jgi:putative cell wall-binding protein
MSKNLKRSILSFLLAFTMVFGLFASGASANASNQWLIDPEHGQLAEVVVSPDKCLTVTVKDERGNLVGGLDKTNFLVEVADADVTGDFNIYEVVNKDWPYPYNPYYNLQQQDEYQNYETTGKYELCMATGTLAADTKYRVTLVFNNHPIYEDDDSQSYVFETDGDGVVTNEGTVTLKAEAKAWPITVKSVSSNGFAPERYVEYEFVVFEKLANGKYALDEDGNYIVDETFTAEINAVQTQSEADVGFKVTNIDGYDGTTEFLEWDGGEYKIGDYVIAPGELIGVRYIGQHLNNPFANSPAAGEGPYTYKGVRKDVIVLNPWKVRGVDRYDGPDMGNQDLEIPYIDGYYNIVPRDDLLAQFVLCTAKLNLKVGVFHADSTPNKKLPVVGAEVDLFKNTTRNLLDEIKWNKEKTLKTNDEGYVTFEDIPMSEVIRLLGLDLGSQVEWLMIGSDWIRHVATSPYGVGLGALPEGFYGFQDVRSVYLPKLLVEAVLNGDETQIAEILNGYTGAFDGIPEGFEFDYGKDCTLTVYTELLVGYDSIKRIAGDNRFATAVEIAKKAFPDGPPARGRWETDGDGTNNSFEDRYRDIIIANGYNYPDALAGGPLAALYNGPILLTARDTLPKETKDYIEYVKKIDNKEEDGALEEVPLPVRVTILGGPLAVSTKVQQELTAMGVHVERVYGTTRAKTAVAIGDQMLKVQNDDNKVKFLHGWGEEATVIVANANNFADVLAVSAPAAEYGVPILLTPTGSLDKSTADAMTRWGVQKAVILGGELAISKNTESAIQNLGIRTDRVAGLNRRSTALEIGKYFDVDTKVYVARDDQFSDALAGAVLAAKDGAKLLLVNTTDLAKNAEVVKYIKDVPVTDITILGGPLAVPNAVRHQLAQAILGN